MNVNAMEEVLGLTSVKAEEKPRIVVSRMIDPAESGYRLRYQIIEILIYAGWPISVSIVLFWLGLPHMWAGILAGLAFTWPVFKGYVGRAMADKGQDPRHMIRSSSFWFDGICGIGSPPLRQIRKFSAFSKSLDMIYNYFGRFGISPEGLNEKWWSKLAIFYPLNLVVKRWTDFWIGMPIAQDVRSRLCLVSRMIEDSIINIHTNLQLSGINRAVKVISLAGGTNQDIILALKGLEERDPRIRVEVVCVEPDGFFSIKRSKKLMKHFGVRENSIGHVFKRVSADAKKKKMLSDILENSGRNFSDFDLVVCIGLGDYQYGKKLPNFISMLDNGHAKIITANVAGNFIERPFLHTFIQWPKMQYLTLFEYLKKIQKVLPNRDLRVTQTPHKIFNVVEIE
jgi:hypothetical protein